MTEAHLVNDCPRCGTRRVTFDVKAQQEIGHGFSSWQRVYEVATVCRACVRVVVWIIELSAFQMEDAAIKGNLWRLPLDITAQFNILGYVSVRDLKATPCPDDVPDEIRSVFEEGALCASLRCPNAAASMFRLCLDLTTKGLLPASLSDDGTGQPNKAQRTRLFDRIEWLISSTLLPADLQEMAAAIREHGNDAAHDGTATLHDAADLQDFAIAVLERVFTMPARVAEARKRYAERRASTS